MIDASARASTSIPTYAGRDTTPWQGAARLLPILRYLAARLAAIPRCCRVPKTNDFRIGARGPNTVLRRANALTKFLAGKLAVPGTDLCDGIAGFQPNNLVGHAFRSLTVHILETFGDRDITYAEEVRPYDEFPGQQFTTHSRDPKIDTVALISSRWRYRHGRADAVEGAVAYAPAAQRHDPGCRLYASVGKFAPNRLDKVLSNCPLRRLAGC